MGSGARGGVETVVAAAQEASRSLMENPGRMRGSSRSVGVGMDAS
jgi:hypothetical protein